MAQRLDTRELAEELDALHAMTDDPGFNQDDVERMRELEALEAEVGEEFRYGETMIPVDEFEDYAREMAEDIGRIPDDVVWPCTCIDWERAARELTADYSIITFEGYDYYVRQ